MSDSGGAGLGAGLILFVPPRPEPGAHPLADPHIGMDDHYSELADGKPRNLLGDVATLVALFGAMLVWALQDSFYLVGFIVSGVALVAGAIALFTPGRRRKSAVAAQVIGAVPFLFTVARLVFHF